MAGRHIALETSIALHGVIGNAVFAFQAILLVLLVVKGASREAKLTAGLLFVLLVAQIGLGYSGRTVPAIVAWHIPLGVALFGMATWQLARIRQ